MDDWVKFQLNMHKSSAIYSSAFLLATLLAILMPLHAGCQERLPLEKIKLPPGFKITVYARGLYGARSLALGEKGTVFVGTIRQGKVYAVVDRDRNNKADRIITLLSGLHAPNGVCVKDGSLYVGEVFRVSRYDSIETRLNNPPKPVVITDKLPRDHHHGWKYLSFGPDNLLYIPVGAPCNVCLKSDRRYASIMRMNADGTNPEIFARGVRNTVGFDWHPESGELWFTDNGRDWLGDNLPPDELNYAPRKGMHFGFPYRYGNNEADPQFGKTAPASMKFTAPIQELDPHVAALGMRFYTGKMFPPSYRNKIFIAEHGSWNRSNKIGYRITTVTLKSDKSAGYEVFASGWLNESRYLGVVKKENVWGRPVDILQMPDGALLISDDMAGCLYRISYSQR